MKTHHVGTCVALALLAAAALMGSFPDKASAHRTQPVGTAQRLPTTPLTLPSGRRISIEVAGTEIQRSIGMMWRTRVPRDTGMLFVFDDEAQQSFWMKNTLVDLDMVFMDGERRITSIAANVPRSHPDTPEDRVAVRTGFGRYVLELPAGATAGYELAVGLQVRFNLKAVGRKGKPKTSTGRLKISAR